MKADSGQVRSRAGRLGDTATVALALATAAGILAISMVAGSAAMVTFESWSGLGDARAFAAGEQARLQTTQLAVSLFTFQAVLIVLILAASWLWPFAADPKIDTVATATATATAADATQRWQFGLLAVSAILVLAGLYAIIVYLVDRQSLAADLMPLIEMVRNDSGWLIAVAAVIGAPLAEELLFRGYLYERLRPTALGAVGTAMVTAIGWASLHFSYTVYGLVAIFLIGLYLFWLRERSGGLALPIATHSIYNAGIVVALLTMPDHWLAALAGGQ